MKRIAVAGSTGSIGTQALDIIARRPDLFEARVLAAGSQVDKLIAQALRFRPALAVIADESKYARLREALEPEGIATACGPTALAEACTRDDVDTVLTATVGYSGLEPTLRAIEAGKDIALANKETLVVAGELVMKRAAASATRIYPVDSEHSAIFQCLMGCLDRAEVKRLILTCSGGPFFGKTREELVCMTKSDALRHPNWKMGAKITVDCATLMNKGLEIIEAMRLYDLPLLKVEAVIHRQSVVHSLVEFVDGAVLAQLGVPDMRIPIQYALTWPDRLPSPVPELDFAALKHLSFDVADDETFRCLAAAKKAIRKGGLGPCAANGANEEAVRLFLQDKIGFLDIGRLVEGMVDSDSFGGDYTLQDVYDCDRMARDYVKAHV